jgi:argininosuccinate lyase
MNVEARLKELIGDAAGRLHTARSRNDQVATDFRLYMRDASTRWIRSPICSSRWRKGRKHAGTIMPGFTHLQTGAAGDLRSSLLAYVEMLGAIAALADARRAERKPARGSGACRNLLPDRPAMHGQGAGLRPADRELARCGVGSRFCAGTLARLSICAMHLSRLAEEIVLWTTPQFASSSSRTSSRPAPRSCRRSAIRMRPNWCGPSRAQISGAFMVQLLVVMKGLPLAYSKDMQEDKEACCGTLSPMQRP